MNILDIIKRPAKPIPWAEGDNIPWSDPAFSERMLAEHLSQDHDLASRREATIDAHVQWIHETLLKGHLTRILDLGCGPGFYTYRLARLGHECVGVDYSPASIQYAEKQAKREKLPCLYIHEDIRQAESGGNFGLVMMIFGEFNVFCPDDAKTILKKVHAALDNDGLLLLEPHTLETVEDIGRQSRSWYSAESGLFSAQPHLCLQENFWKSETKTATTRYFIVDAQNGLVTRHAASYQGYSDEEYQAILTKAGFCNFRMFPALAGDADTKRESLIAITAGKET